ncbi:protein-tyrosine phosphatase-like protein [Peziza echinospora]|nr:protein-tyrosine phosphatase-like protein [Peziza echinospora]
MTENTEPTRILPTSTSPPSAAEAAAALVDENLRSGATGATGAVTTSAATVASTTTDFTKPPWVAVPGVANFRDVGGYPIRIAGAGESEGGSGIGRSRRNLIYRSAEPSRITPEGKIIIQELGIRKMYDLRSEAELGRLGDMAKVIEVEGVERVFAPVIRNEDYSPQALAKRYEQYMTGNLQSAYRSIIKSSATSYRQIFRHLLQPSPPPILIHCTAGKDRTGILVALVLLLAGVPDGTIAREYELTAKGLVEVKEMIINYLMKDEKSMAGGGRERAENMLSSRSNTMIQFLDILRSEFGGVEGYLKDICGFSDEEVERLREAVVEKDEKPLFDEEGEPVPLL